MAIRGLVDTDTGAAIDPDGRYVQPGDLATVATSGAYADLSGTPTIPSTPGDIGAEPAGVVAAHESSYTHSLIATAVQPGRLITAGSGLTGGGDLSADRTLALSAGSITSLAKADTALQPGGNAGTPSAIVLTNGTGLPSTGISDSTATGRSVLTAADAAAARAAIGARDTSPIVPAGLDTTGAIAGQLIVADGSNSGQMAPCLPFGHYLPGRYYSPALSAQSSVNAGFGGVLWRAFPWFVYAPITIDRVLIEIVTAASSGGLANFGIYTNKMTSGQCEPDALIANSASSNIATDSTGVKTADLTPFTLQPGLYWAASQFTNTPTIRAVNISGLPNVLGYPETAGLNFYSCKVANVVFGAMPATAPAVTDAILNYAGGMWRCQP